MTDVERALLGDHEAAKRLTNAGVLVPCGHCGKQAYISVDPECEPDGAGRKWAYTAVCGTCCATSGLCYSAYMARLAWNTRTAILAPEQLAALEKMEGSEIGEHSTNQV